MGQIARLNLQPLKIPLKGFTHDQLEGFAHIMKSWNESGLEDLRWLAYMLATAWHETARTMKPIREYGLGAKHAYGKPDPITGQIYYGRGYVQLTHKFNYEAYGIENDPDRALEPELAAHIMIDGMTRGVFTGKKLGRYFNDKIDDPYNARRIINGLDCAEKIAGYHRLFLANLTKELDSPRAA